MKHLHIGLVLGAVACVAAATAAPHGAAQEPRVGQAVKNFAGMEFMYIPASSFTMGSDSNVKEQPVRQVNLSAYWIGKNDVTVAQFRDFCTTTKYAFDWDKNKPFWGWIDSHPMVNVSWGEARACCKWLGGDLPTEAQWEKAARGPDARAYPWGAAWIPNACRSSDWDGTRPVGSYPRGASPYGCLDMAGNVCQWCLDWFGDYDATKSIDPTGPDSGTLRTMRGGDWWSFDKKALRTTTRYRYLPDARLYNAFGFRCVVNSRELAPSGGVLDASLLVPNPPPPISLEEWNRVAPTHRLEPDLSGHTIPWGQNGTSIGDETTNPKDQMEFVWVPAATFVMGTDEDEGDVLKSAHPAKQISLPGYWIAKYPVTTGQYNLYRVANSVEQKLPETTGKKALLMPAVNVNWGDADAYTKWAGVALPTEFQWEHAARGPKNYRYPWGNTWDRTKCAFDQAHADPVDFHAKGRSAFGCYDMAGNVWQWCAGWGSPNYVDISDVNPASPTPGYGHPVRGASWRQGFRPYFRSSAREFGHPRALDDSMGFRCAVVFH